jgi:succinate dehydrogenase / fumarate reductase membrane anchor subunit
MTHLRNPLATAKGLGSAKAGSHHWIVQRLTAVALVPLSLWFLFCVASTVGTQYAEARGLIAQPLQGALLAAFVIALFYHAQLGLQVVVEDYVHTKWVEVALQIAIKLVCIFAALVSLLAIVRIALGG